MKDKEYWINKFDLQPHPKETKGFFKETFRDEFTVIGSSGEQRSVIFLTPPPSYHSPCLVSSRRSVQAWKCTASYRVRPSERFLDPPAPLLKSVLYITKLKFEFIYYYLGLG